MKVSHKVVRCVFENRTASAHFVSFVESFKVVSLFNYQGSYVLLFQATTLIDYHFVACLSTTFFKKISHTAFLAGAKNIIANGLYSVNNILCENIVFFYGCLDVVPMRKTTSKYCYCINIEETHFPQSEIPPTDLMPCPELKI